jgi:phosphoribosyl 1,2-cyclic phosphodiesterase
LRGKERRQMKIKCWGARGSIPVSGIDYLKYGGETTCIEIRTKEDEIVIIDAGSGLRKLGNKLLAENRFEYNLVFTHSHWDHILGFPFFRPLYIEGTRINMFGCPFAQDSVKRLVANTMEPPNFPVKFQELKAEISYHGACDGSFWIQSMKVIPILLSHPNQGIGYKFFQDEKSFVFLTDNELSFKHPGGLDYADYVNFSSGADLLFHDAEFTDKEYETKRTWGHSTYSEALKLALEAQVKQFGLFHHNQERTDTALDDIVRDCQRLVKNSGASLECFAVSEGMEIRL